MKNGTHIQVIAAVVYNACGKLLIAKRPKHLHQGGLWEFPGGKLEPGESALDALARELEEELGISVKDAAPLLKVRHQYPEKWVELDVWRVQSFSGAAHGREGQQIAWIYPGELRDYQFPAANEAIITHLEPG